jgi:hypothetical protein
MIIASARAGGDLWDNPRYRTIFLPWLTFITAWAWKYRGKWLYRLLIMEGIFIAFFTEWYLARYYFGSWLRMPFWHILMWVAFLSALIIVDGLAIGLWKRYFRLPVNYLRLRLIEGIVLSLFFEWYVSHHYFTAWMQTSAYVLLQWIIAISGLTVIGLAIWDVFRSEKAALKMQRNGND